MADISILIKDKQDNYKTVNISRLAFVIVLSLTFVLLFLSTYSIYRISEEGYISFKLKNEIDVKDSINRKILKYENRLSTQNLELAHFLKKDSIVKVSYGLLPIDSDVIRLGIGGSPLKSEVAKENFKAESYIKSLQLLEQIEHYNNKIEFIDTSISQTSELINREQNRLKETPTMWPTVGRVTSPFGYRMHPILHKRIFHEGYDIANKEWTPIYAPADGVCIQAGMSIGGYGIIVKLNHPSSGFQTRYAHLAGVAVKKGTFVKRGDIIGYMGNTGRSTGTHLHYEVIKNNRRVDPKDYLLAKFSIVANSKK